MQKELDEILDMSSEKRKWNKQMIAGQAAGLAYDHCFVKNKTTMVAKSDHTWAPLALSPR
jgi:hypothetical protein